VAVIQARNCVESRTIRALITSYGIAEVSAKIVNGCRRHVALQNLEGQSNTPNKFYSPCVVEDSESAKQEHTEWQPGSAQAQFGVNHRSRWRCQH
jgi:hypothetical protein